MVSGAVTIPVDALIVRTWNEEEGQVHRTRGIAIETFQAGVPWHEPYKETRHGISRYAKPGPPDPLGSSMGSLAEHQNPDWGC